MNAVLLCAGFATRMYPLTENFPKPLLPVADKPVIDYLMEDIMSLESIREVHVVSNSKFFSHFQGWLESHLAQGSFSGVTVRIHDDGCLDNAHRLGASGCLQLALQAIGKPSRLLVSAGDNIYRFRLGPLWSTFLQSGAHHVVALPEHSEERLKRTGVLEFGSAGNVVRLHEKPEQPSSYWSCPPLYFFQPTVWEILDRFLQSSANHDAPGYFVDYLCQRETVRSFQLDSSRLDIGSIDTYRAADRIVRSEGVVPQNVW